MAGSRLVAILLAGAMLAAGPPAAHRAAAAAQPLQPFGVRDLVRLQRLVGIEAAPAGGRLVLTLRATDMEAGSGHTGLWLLDSERHGAAPARLAPGTGADSAAQWSADGRFVYFLSTRGGTSQVWRIAPAGGEPLQITQLPLDVGSFRVSPRGDRIVVSVATYLDCDDFECTANRLQAAAKSKSSGVLYDRLFVRHWDAWSDGRRTQLFSLHFDEQGKAAGKPLRLSAGLDGDIPGRPFGGREDYVISPDGADVVFSVRAAGNDEPWSTNFDLYAVPVDGGEPRNLTADNPAWDARPAFSPDGTRLAYLAMDRAGFEADRFHLMILDWKTGAKHPLTQSWDRSIDAYDWSRDGKTLFATAGHLGQQPLWAIDAATGRASAITADGTVDTFSVGAKKIFYAASTLGSPADAFSVPPDGGTPARLTRINAELLARRRLADYEQFGFAGWNGENVYAYLVKPAGFKRGARYPLAVLIHGGPQGSLANTWHYRWNAQAFAGAGYAVLLIDFHGSTGYGQAFTDSISGDWGGKPFEDIKAGVAAALEKYPWLDGRRACALGGSYGGYMVNWIAGQWPERFKCLVDHAGVFDSRAMYYSTDELWFEEWEHGGTQYQNPAAYEKFNPVDFVARWKTPMLVSQGGLDYRIPYAQGLSAFTALQRRAIPSRFLYFPDENHWILKPYDSIEWYDTVIDWMNRWTGE